MKIPDGPLEIKDRNNKCVRFFNYEGMIFFVIHNEYGQGYVPDEVLDRMYSLLFKGDYEPDREHKTEFRANCIAFASILGYHVEEMKLYTT